MGMHVGREGEEALPSLCLSLRRLPVNPIAQAHFSQGLWTTTASRKIWSGEGCQVPSRKF